MDDMGEELLSTEIFGMPVPKGKTVVVGTAITGDDEEHVVHHLTQFALGDAPSKGRHTVWLQPEGGPKIAIGTLELGRVEHFQVDYMSQAPLQVYHSGGSDVYVSGYKTVYPLPADMGPDDEDTSDDDFNASDEDDAEEEDEEDSMLDNPNSDDSDDEDVADPAEVKEMTEHFKQDSLEDVIPRRLTGNKAKATAAALIDDEADDDEGNEDDEEEESDEESGDGDTEEDDGEEGGGLDAREFSSMDGSDEEGDEGDEGSSGDDDDDEDEAPALVPAPTPKSAKKRAAETAPIQTPKSAKQPKTEPKTPASGVKAQKADPKTPGTGAYVSGDHKAAEAEYEATLIVYLTEHGSVKLSTLGVACPKPEGMPKSLKLKKFLEGRAFKIDAAAGLVSLA